MPAVVVSIASASGRAIQKQKPKSNPPNNFDDTRKTTFQMFRLFSRHISGNCHQVSPCYETFYLNLALQRPMTSPWQTSSALNSEPSSVR